MKPIKSMTQAELAAYVQSHLRQSGIEVILSGGAAVGVFSENEYVSRDIDFVNASFAERKHIEEAMHKIGFSPVGRHFEHPDSVHIIEFPPGPLSIGNAMIKEIFELEFDTGVLQVISPTDCTKDRLAHYYHWGDRQCLKQAILVAKHHQINLAEIEEWSRNEGKLIEFNKIKGEL
jgi:hypothetical protein